MAKAACEHSRTLPLSEQALIAHGVATLFPPGSQEAIEANETAAAFAEAEKRQCKFHELLLSATNQ